MSTVFSQVLVSNFYNQKDFTSLRPTSDVRKHFFQTSKLGLSQQIVKWSTIYTRRHSRNTAVFLKAFVLPEICFVKQKCNIVVVGTWPQVFSLHSISQEGQRGES